MCVMYVCLCVRVAYVCVGGTVSLNGSRLMTLLKQNQFCDMVFIKEYFGSLFSTTTVSSKKKFIHDPPPYILPQLFSANKCGTMGEV